MFNWDILLYLYKNLHYVIARAFVKPRQDSTQARQQQLDFTDKLLRWLEALINKCLHMLWSPQLLLMSKMIHQWKKKLQLHINEHLETRKD